MEQVFIVLRRHATEEGQWDTIIDVFSDETVAGIYALDLEEKLEECYRSSTEYYVKPHTVKKAIPTDVAA